MCISFAISLSLSLPLPLSLSFSSGVAVSVTTSGNWIGNFVVAMVTPLLLGSVLKTAGTFYILAGFLFASFLFVLLTLPETKGESLERIDQLFLRPWIQRINLFYYLRYMYMYASGAHERKGALSFMGTYQLHVTGRCTSSCIGNVAGQCTSSCR